MQTNLATAVAATRATKPNQTLTNLFNPQDPPRHSSIESRIKKWKQVREFHSVRNFAYDQSPIDGSSYVGERGRF
jgi:hypothetical protein